MRRKRTLLIACLPLLAWGQGCIDAMGAPPEQPVLFSHQVHVEKGADCAFCHEHFEANQAAGTPPVELCMTCHMAMPGEHPEIQKLFAFADSSQPIPWARMHQLPPYIYFTHKWHIRAGLECSTCHGEIGEFDGVAPYRNFQMAGCVDCHNQEHASVDCVTCHK